MNFLRGFSRGDVGALKLIQARRAPLIGQPNTAALPSAAGLEVSDSERLRRLESENAKQKKLLGGRHARKALLRPNLLCQ
jgi:hypothetical protein